MYKILMDKLPALYAALQQEGRLYLPCKNKAGKADFAPYTEQAQVLLDAPFTERSAKDLFFPQVENLLTFTTEGKRLSLEQQRPEEERTILMGVRACDVRSFAILDRVFLQQPVDTYYAARRANCVILGLGCSAPEETCFCHAFGIDATAPEADVRTWLVQDALYWEPVTEKGKMLTEAVDALLEQSAAAPEVAEQQEQTKKVLELLPLHGFKVDDRLPQQELQAFNSSVWEKLSSACLACCTCTYVCPTCHCYDIRDYQATESKTQRYRCWDSCMAADFTKMAHGNPRKTKLERFRQRYMHKLVYFPENNEGVYACVGCGRCLKKCPVNLNIVKVAKALEVSGDV